MRISIDYTPALRQYAGIGRYTRNLTAALAEIDRENAYTLFCMGAAPESAAFPPNFRVRTTRVPSRWLTAGWHKLRLPLPVELLAGSSDIYHSMDFTLPPLHRARGVVTIHDLSYLRLPAVADPGLRNYLLQAVPRALTRAAHIVADSTHTKLDIQELLDVPAAKISVVPGGVETRFHPVHDTAQLASVRSRYGLPKKFILFVGTLEPRKNLPRLISAFGQARRGAALPHRLIIAGRQGWLFEEIYQRVETERLDDAVQFIGYTQDADLPALYTLADFVAFPSLYEGFGLPPLEAMACGTPVVTGDNSSLPEAVGDAALLVDVEDADALADALVRAATDESLRSRLSVLGPQQAAHFTWGAAAEKLMAVYRLTQKKENP